MGIKQTFAALTVKELADQASPIQNDEATESAIASLIMSGAVTATLVQHSSGNISSMLRFSGASSSPRLSDERRAQEFLVEERRCLETLMTSLDEISHHLGLSDEFVDGMQKGAAWANVEDINPEMGEDAGLEIDEDLMDDVS